MSTVDRPLYLQWLKMEVSRAKVCFLFICYLFSVILNHIYSAKDNSFVKDMPTIT